jgi:GxxExxY protein
LGWGALTRPAWETNEQTKKRNKMNQNEEVQRNRLNELSHKVIGLCIEIHRELGPGLLESAYEECLAYELSTNNLRFERQRPLAVRYKEVQLDCGYRIDFVVEDALIIELKAVTELLPIHEAQLLTYLKLDKKPLGLAINFNLATLTKGVKRVVSGDLFRDEAKNRSFGFRLFQLLCASVPLWFK